MSYLKEQAEWADGIYQIETSDPVLGGPDGITNRPARELANRTAWLKQQLKAAEAALRAHTRSRNHPDASVSEKGFVKLSNANQSSSETEAATPKAVKIVNDRLNAVVDHAPSDLDTLNKLAQAISNNPKFAESVTQLLSQKLAKNENGADIPDKNLFLENLGLTETVDCAKNALDKRTGGTVNGDIISQGGVLSLKGDDRKHLGIHNQDGSVRMWLFKDKGGDGVRLNNGSDGGGEYVFHKDGGFHAPSSVYAGAARIAHDGNIYGSQWGNQWLDAYLKKTFQPKGVGQAYTKEESDARYVRDVQRGAVSAIYTPEGVSTDASKGCVMVGVTLSGDGSSGTHVYQVRYCPLQIKINGAWRTISDISDSK